MRRRDRWKFERLLRFSEALPRMRRAVARDLALPGFPRERVLACMLRILSKSFLRPGSQAYADENGSFGLATLRAEHVHVNGPVVAFDFPGKSGKQHQRVLQDRQVARAVRGLLRLPGRDVFKCRAADGTIVDVRRRHLNEYIRETMGERFTAKDFRTWAGTLLCACALARAGAATSVTERKRRIVAAIRDTAEQLGNTPAVCRASYVHPAVLDRYARGRTVRDSFGSLGELVDHQSARLRRCERELTALLQGDTGAKATRERPARSRGCASSGIGASIRRRAKSGSASGCAAQDERGPRGNPRRSRGCIAG